MARTKTIPIQDDGPRIFVPRPQGGSNIRELRAGDTKLTDDIAKSDQIQIVNRRKRTEETSFKIKKLPPERKIVQIKKDGQVVKTINVNRKSYYFNGVKAKRY